MLNQFAEATDVQSTEGNLSAMGSTESHLAVHPVVVASRDRLDAH